MQEMAYRHQIQVNEKKRKMRKDHGIPTHHAQSKEKHEAEDDPFSDERSSDSNEDAS